MRYMEGWGVGRLGGGDWGKQICLSLVTTEMYSQRAALVVKSSFLSTFSLNFFLSAIIFSKIKRRVGWV